MNKGLIGAIIVIVLLIGGVIYWAGGISGVSGRPENVRGSGQGVPLAPRGESRPCPAGTKEFPRRHGPAGASRRAP